MTTLNELAREINETATKSGFWEGERNFGEMLMLATSELAEALEEHRDGKPDLYYSVKSSPSVYMPINTVYVQDGLCFSNAACTIPANLPWLTAQGVKLKPEGVSIELVDCLIRLLDTLHSRGVDIDELVQIKMEYNASRPFKHGKAY